MTTIREVGEFGLIARMRDVLGAADDPDVVIGIDDDAAVYRVGDGRVHLVTTDALIEGIPFERALTPMEHLGFKALSVNVSDVVAMNGRPRFATIALGLPDAVYVEAVEAFYRGLKRGCEAYGVTLLGGDTTAAHRMTISVTVIGEADEADVVYRRGARVGDLLCVTGDLGGAYAGLKVLLDQHEEMRAAGDAYAPDLDEFQYVIGRQLAPTARLQAVQDWAARGVRPHALIDISDGLASEVHHLCAHSGCGALLYGAALPIDLATRRAADHFAEDVDTYALFGGEDYELLFALPEAALAHLDPDSLSAVGICTDAREGVRIQTAEGGTVSLGSGGYQHFGATS